MNQLLDNLLPALWPIPWREHADCDTYGAKIGEWGQVWLHTEPTGKDFDLRWKATFRAPGVELVATGEPTREGLTLVVGTIRENWRAKVREERRIAIRKAAVYAELLAYRTPKRAK